MSWEGTSVKLPYVAMSHETIPAITTRIEHWATSFLYASRELSELDSCSPTFLTVVPCETKLSPTILLSPLPASRTACAVG
jgi:hypothetical protein